MFHLWFGLFQDFFLRLGVLCVLGFWGLRCGLGSRWWRRFLLGRRAVTLRGILLILRTSHGVGPLTLYPYRAEFTIIIIIHCKPRIGIGGEEAWCVRLVQGGEVAWCVRFVQGGEVAWCVRWVQGGEVAWCVRLVQGGEVAWCVRLVQGGEVAWCMRLVQGDEEAWCVRLVQGARWPEVWG